MPAPNFVHLRLHSEYSLQDGIVRLSSVTEKVRYNGEEQERCLHEGVIERAAKENMGALALTDLANMFGMIKFYNAARSAGIKPLIGVDAWIAAEDAAGMGRAPAQRLLLLARNHAGYLRLCALLTAAYQGKRRQGRAEIPRTAIANGDNSGIIALSGAQTGEIGQWLQQGDMVRAQVCAKAWADLFPDNFFIELHRPHAPATAEYIAQEILIEASLELAVQTSLPVVATHPVQFLNPEDFEAHEARVCIAEGQQLDDARRPRHFSAQQYFKSQGEMTALFADIPVAIANSVAIAQRCNLVLALGKAQLPVFPVPAQVADNVADYLALQAHRGLETRLHQLFPEAKARASAHETYSQRLDFEIAIIQKMGFSGYFLIVADFIGWAKNNGVPVGPGRGSGAGSLVAYALGITDLDPIHYDLLFERFLNPERVSMPDFDIDFCQEGRDRVIRYVKDKYGAHAVSQIVTFGTLSAKAVVRDVGRVLGMSYNEVDRFAKLIPNELEMTLGKAFAQEAEISERLAREQESSLPALWALAQKLEGLTRNVGMHAGGVLIAPGSLTDFCPLYSADDGQTMVSQFDKVDVEEAGLVKFDFLGLRTLTTLAHAVALVAQTEHITLDLTRLPLDDRMTYEDVFKTGETTAVFQFESAGMKDQLIRARPDCIEDLIALNALYRPGPMENIPSFIRRKHGQEKINYPHPSLEPVLANTYGIMVYQEQVMQTARVIANYSLGDADLLRRAMGKKKPEEMAQQRAVFIDGAAQNGILERQANAIFDTMETFAGYGFNKSHAAAYSVLAFHTAWMKRHHPAAFMAATLTSEAGNTDKVQFFLNDAQRLGLRFLGPDINASNEDFRPVDQATIRYGLAAIKGTGSAAISTILAVRTAQGPFLDLFDFCRRVDKQRVNRRVIEALINAGAFDGIDDHRHKLLASVGVALEAAEHAERHALQESLFDHAEQVSGRPETPYLDVPRWSAHEQLAQEKQALGFYFSGHPFTAHRAEIARFVKRGLGDLVPDREPQLLAGLVHSVRTQMTRNGKMAVVMLDDGQAQVEVTVFNELWDEQRDKIQPDRILLVEGRVQQDEYSVGGLRIAASSLLTLGEVRARFARALRIRINGTSRPEDMNRLKGLLGGYCRTVGCPVRIVFRNQQATGEMLLPDTWRVIPEDALLSALDSWLTPEATELQYG